MLEVFLFLSLSPWFSSAHSVSSWKQRALQLTIFRHRLFSYIAPSFLSLSFLAAYEIFSPHFSSHIFLLAPLLLLLYPPSALPLSILRYPVLEQTQGNQMCGESGQMGGVERSDRQGKKVIEYKQQRWKKINGLCSYACWRCDNKLCTIDDILRGIFDTHLHSLSSPDSAGFKISRTW